MFQTEYVAGIVVAAGNSTRMGFDKLFYRLNTVEILRLSVQKLDAHPYIDTLVVVAGENIAQVQSLFAQFPPQKPLQIVPGGTTRTASVAAGAAACPKNTHIIAIHDAARPFVSADVISRTIAAAAQTGAAAPAIPLKDTVKQINKTNDCMIVNATLPRNTLMAVQTPQVFRLPPFLKALAHIPLQEYSRLTDDCMVMERAGHPVCLVAGEEENRKITTAADLPQEKNMSSIRIGHGYDVHKFAENRALILGGVEIPYKKGLLGHSDADVLLHAITDALLGAAALGDIGQHFPDTDAAYKNISSALLLQKVQALLQNANYSINNIDATILCQAPKLAPHLPAMRQTIAEVLKIPLANVNIKATTEEGLGFTGREEGIAAHCVALVFATA